MKWKLTKDLPELKGKIFPSQTEGFYFQVVSASKKLGLEMIALDDVNERYHLFDIPTTSSSIAQALREEAEELVFQWMHPEQSDIEETRQKMVKVDNRKIFVPYCGNPFEKTEALGFMVEEKREMVWSHDASAASKTRSGFKGRCLDFEREDSSGGQGTTHCT